MSELRERQRQCLELAARGLTVYGIALELGLSHHTVRHHFTALYQTLDADRLVPALVEAVTRGLIEVPEAYYSERENPLTPRQAQVLGCLAAGLTWDGTAAALGLSQHTVKNHMSRSAYSHRPGILRRLGVQCTATAVLKALANGWIVHPWAAAVPGASSDAGEARLAA